LRPTHIPWVDVEQIGGGFAGFGTLRNFFRRVTLLSAKHPLPRFRFESGKDVQCDGKIFDLWLACHTQEEIGEILGCERGEIRGQADNFGEIGNLAESAKSAASHLTDFDQPLYNVWKQPSALISPPLFSWVYFRRHCRR
jgi:hypothetical protein